MSTSPPWAVRRCAVFGCLQSVFHIKDCFQVTKDPRRGSAHDEMMCRKLKVPISIQTIIDSPVDEFNQLIERYPLSARQVTLIRDIRRRGKNKVSKWHSAIFPLEVANLYEW